MSNKDINLLTYSELRAYLNFTEKPGLNTQLYMAPAYRKKLIEENKMIIEEDARIAAILILLYRENNEWFFPMILRNTYKGVHSNQIGFPGGKYEDTDKNLSSTAIRESFEEISAIPNNIDVIGDLTELYIPPSHFMVHPFVGLYKGKPNFKPCDREVKQIIPINLSKFILENKVVTMTVQSKGSSAEVPAYELPQGVKVWGASAMMLSEFYIIFKKSLNL